MPPTAQWRRIFEGPVDSPSFEGSPCSCCHSMPAVVVVVVFAVAAAAAVDSAVVVFVVANSHDFRCHLTKIGMKSCWHCLAAKAHEGLLLCTHKGHRSSHSHRCDSSPPAGQSTWSTRRERWRESLKVQFRRLRLPVR